ncbi:4a-hydroxytetrahydrobiopterin dehydratase [Candidatus Berkelbacteria bacterium CG10_big_fil_rev_8_21_14_0_10_43_13]|uniref:4a-hydroxytetrahydrobiopterin dehydratase n=1 Tax=Candidatus Berkelbacteria bacterium CG10_big_fil_rev_8_21_14_0_10_43_13 TaxID=1974514 RepID=A0A2H0W749_9BACT|nr:MAG: 4a-hydroxytetrahydrobiopterin dehydratase [Candidatus Berkelbacteria bacterium CG10_big_fil_rev_8_21_14_0_10_43_13]
MVDTDIQPLSEAEIAAKLKELPADWEYKENKISKTFEFENMMDGIRLLDKLIPYCNEIDHHPDIVINFKKFKFELTRWDAGQKVTPRDFLIAMKIEELLL